MLNEWLTKEDEYIDALLDFEDIGKVLLCGHCNRDNKPLFRCAACIGTSCYCKDCTVLMHRENPFHRIALWDQASGCFRDTSLAAIGLVVILGHVAPYIVCPNPGSLLGLTAVHTNGIHNISIQSCECPHAKSLDLQLFDQRLFPASVHSPQTAFSFTVLEQFRYHHLEGKGSAYTFMNALYRLTDDTGCMEVEVCIFSS